MLTPVLQALLVLQDRDLHQRSLAAQLRAVPEDQARVVARLVGYLRPRGILCLGHSETARDPALPINRLDVPSAYVRH